MRDAFIFLKENLEFELKQDDLIQRELLDERDKEDRICRVQCKAFWSERYLKLLIKKKRCNKFISFIKKTPLFGGIFSELLIRKQGEIIKKTNITARGNVTEFKYCFSIFHI